VKPKPDLRPDDLGQALIEAGKRYSRARHFLPKRTAQRLHDHVVGVLNELDEADRRAGQSENSLLADEQAEAVLDEARAQGQALIHFWILQRKLIPTHELAAAWRITGAALHAAQKRNDLFSFKHANRLYYPGVFRDLESDSVYRVCHALGTAAPSQKLLFWMREHGGLAGRTPGEALAQGKLERVLQIAEAWAEERGVNVPRDAA
jgi:hypothetical protein